MGYETKIVIVDKSNHMFSFENKFWGEKIAEFNLCKMAGEYMKKLDKFRISDCYYYADDGDTRIEKDKYNEPLKEITLSALIKILEKEDQSYWRIPIIIKMLKGFIEQEESSYRCLRALHFGY
jgi:hypothetical protein